MTDFNLVNLEDFKKNKTSAKAYESYERYLKSLGNGQLETEIRVLKEEPCDQIFISKGKILSAEIASRADGEWKKSIESLNRGTLRII